MEKLLASLEEGIEFFVSSATEKKSTRLAKWLASILPENFIVSFLPVHLQNKITARQCYVFHAAEYMVNPCDYDAFVVPVDPEESGMESTIYAVGKRDGEHIIIRFCPAMLFEFIPDNMWYEEALAPTENIGTITMADFAEMGLDSVPIVRGKPKSWTYEEAAFCDYLKKLDAKTHYYMRGTAFRLFQSSCATEYDDTNAIDLFMKLVSLMDSFDSFRFFTDILAQVKAHASSEEIVCLSDLAF